MPMAMCPFFSMKKATLDDDDEHPSAQGDAAESKVKLPPGHPPISEHKAAEQPTQPAADAQPMAERQGEQAYNDPSGQLVRKPALLNLQNPIRLNVVNGTFVGTQDTKDLLQAIGGADKVIEMTDRFYQKCSIDPHVDQFIAEQHDLHGSNLGLWIAEKMGAEGQPWTSSRAPAARTRAHAAAWNSPKREAGKQGQRFKLDDCRAWMRLMFWSAREVGLDEAAEGRFFDWYVHFIGHFIGVYERKAPPYTQESAAWSADPANIKKYVEDGRRMKDVVGIARR